MRAFGNSGELLVGVNFWGSKHGIRMWREWDADSIEQDLKSLADNKIKLLRVFPDWEYFQPIEEIKGYRCGHRGYSNDHGLTLLSDKNEQSGLNETAFEHFGEFLKLAEKYDIDIIPSILTGWMSGRMFIPNAVDGDPITDSKAIKFEIRFIRAFVKRFKSSNRIKAWCIGNECNCLGRAETAEQAWVWTATVTDAIKAIDDRPVISGMHSLSMPGEGVWTIRDQAENCDILTTHPYGSPTYNSDIDPINTFKPLMHPAANNVFYSSIGGKPSIIEETGTFGEMYADEEATADYVRCCLWSAFAYDCRGYMWWIAFDQGHLTYYPFYTNNRGSNYGVMTSDRKPKLRLNEFKEFNEFSKKFNRTLPKRIVDGVCILTKGQKSWPVAYGTWLLARQAGIDIEFCYANDELPDAKLYFLPSIADQESVRADMLDALMQKVADGAMLYVSSGNGVLRNFCSDFGVHIKTRQRFSGKKELNFIDGTRLNISTEYEYTLEPTGCEILAIDENGDPVYTSAKYGNGRVFWLPIPVEQRLYDIVGAFHKTDSPKYRKIYDEVADRFESRKCAKILSDFIGVTEHILDDTERMLILINYSPEPITAELKITKPIKSVTVYHGDGELKNNNGQFTVSIEPNSPLVLSVGL